MQQFVDAMESEHNAALESDAAPATPMVDATPPQQQVIDVTNIPNQNEVPARPASAASTNASVMYSPVTHQAVVSRTTTQSDADVAMTVDSQATAAYEQAIASSGTNQGPPPHQFAVGTILYTKFSVSETESKFNRGKVTKLLDDGMYSMAYDDGDIYTVPGEFLFTQKQVSGSDIVTWLRQMNSHCVCF